MDPGLFQRTESFGWQVAPHGQMRVPAIIFADEHLIQDMDQKVYEQLTNVATLPGIVKAAYAMPDAHWGYGFPIGGVAAFDASQGGVVSAGGVGFDVSCGVRTMVTGLQRADIAGSETKLADALYATVPVGVGSTGRIHLGPQEMDRMLAGGARWAVEAGYGEAADLERIEEGGCVAGAQLDAVSQKAKQRQRNEMGTLGSGNHYLELQEVCELFDTAGGGAFGIDRGDLVLWIHCGSRGLGHQIGTEYLRQMVEEAPAHGLSLPDRELACAPIDSALGRRYLGAMHAAINCALANREIIGHLARGVFAKLFPQARLELLFDVSHNTCKIEEHVVSGRRRQLYIHRKGATRAFGPDHPELPTALRPVGQPVFIGGSMGTSSYILVGTKESAFRAFSSACHGAGRSLSRHAAARRWRGRAVIDELAAQGITVRSPSSRGVAEEAPGAYKDVAAVVDLADRAQLSRKVARLRPVVCIKG